MRTVRHGAATPDGTRLAVWYTGADSDRLMLLPLPSGGEIGTTWGRVDNWHLVGYVASVGQGDQR